MNDIEALVAKYIEENRIKPYWREGKALLDFARWATVAITSKPAEMRVATTEDVPIHMHHERTQVEAPKQKARKQYGH